MSEPKEKKMRLMKSDVQRAFANHFKAGSPCDGTYQYGRDDEPKEFTYEDLVEVLPEWVVTMIRMQGYKLGRKDGNAEAKGDMWSCCSMDYKEKNENGEPYKG